MACMALALGGCATGAQRQAQQTGAGLQDIKAEAKACFAAVRSKPEYQPLLVHSPDLDSGQPTMAQLTNETLPSPSEARLVAASYDDASRCRNRILSALSGVRPDIVPILSNTYIEGSTVTALLVQRKITWAESARRGQSRLGEMRQRLAEADRQWITDLNASHQAEMAQRQAAANALMQMSAQQQMINAMNRPVVTNCFRTGGFVNCTSQ